MRMELVVAAIGILITACVVRAKDMPAFTEAELAFPGKKGACFTLRDPATAKKSWTTWDKQIKKVKALDVYWNYSWGDALVGVQPNDIEFVPMIFHGRDPGRVKDSISTKVLPAIKNGRVKKLLAFNEPDREEQGNTTPEEALALWPVLESAGVPLCSPSATHADDEWMERFMKGVDKHDFRVDYIGVHSYGGADAKKFKDKLRKIYELHGKRPLLVTEFACADWKAESLEANRCSPAKVLAFMKEVLPWMEAQDWIAGYAWFSFRPDSKPGSTSALFDEAGALTACGRYYKSVTRENPKGDQSIKPDPPRK